MSENLFSRGGGDRGFVEQFFDTFRRSEPLEPERVLLLAILEDAVANLRNPRRQWIHDARARVRCSCMALS
jgi:hypothetical protein